MSQKIRLFSCFLIGITLICCKSEAEKRRPQKAIKPAEIVEEQPYKGTGKLIPIDFRDSNYTDVQFYAKDTLTKGGWSIKYFVKDDSTRYDDIYIQWSNKKRSGLYCADAVLQFRRYFIPKYKGENDQHLFFTHACATTCKAILTFSKGKDLATRSFVTMIGYHIPNGQVVYVADNDYSDNALEVAVVDLNKKVEKQVSFKNKPLYLEADQNIDSVYFSKNRIKLFATMIDITDKTGKKMIKESHQIDLP